MSLKEVLSTKIKHGSTALDNIPLPDGSAPLGAITVVDFPPVEQQHIDMMWKLGEPIAQQAVTRDVGAFDSFAVFAEDDLSGRIVVTHLLQSGADMNELMKQAGDLRSRFMSGDFGEHPTRIERARMWVKRQSLKL
jgi:hypothetical protein